MEVKAISFTGKTQQINPAKARKAYNDALANILGQSNKDYFAISKKTTQKPQNISEDFLKKAKKFFSHVFC